MKNIQSVSDSYLCCNCGACNAICPKDAISFRWSRLGRKYASVDYDKCVDCGMCVKICPSLNDATKGKYKNVPGIDDFISIFVGRSTDEDIYSNSQSGGIVTSVLYYLLKEKKIDAAVVCKMTFGYPPKVEGCVVTDYNDLKYSQKSCYTPVDMLSALKSVSCYSSVAFVGLPCHIQGLTNLQYNFKKYCNVKYKFGLICDRTLCNSIQNVILSYYGTGPAKIDWRNKMLLDNEFRYQYAPIRISSNERSSIELPCTYRFALKSFFTSPRCFLCSDKLNILSDISFGDPWGIPGVDNIHGESVIFARTNIGNNILDELRKNEIIAIRKIENRALAINGQNVDRKQYEASVYAKAMKRQFPNIADCFLLNCIVEPSDADVVWAKVEIKRFLKRDGWTLNKIKRKAKLIVTESMTSHKKNIVERLVAKFLNKLIYIYNLYNL